MARWPRLGGPVTHERVTGLNRLKLGRLARLCHAGVQDSRL